jgi:hypothetical protein
MSYIRQSGFYMSKNINLLATPHNRDNLPISNLEIETVKYAFITRSMLVGTIKGVHPANLVQNLPASWKRKFNFIFAGSLIKNKLSFLKDEGKDYFFCFHPWGTGYHHWLSEIAPKFLMFEEELRKGIILVPSRSPRFILEFLELFEFNNIKFYENNCFTKRVKIINNPNSGHYNINHLLDFKEKVLKKVISNQKQKPNKIYVSRKNARARRVINENELIEKLQNRGFSCLELDNFSFIEQVKLFSNCKVLISLHGAAITNSIFMPLNGQILELFPENPSDADLNACYYRLANVLGHKHKFIWCRREYPNRNFCLDTDNIVVNIDAVEELIN